MLLSPLTFSEDIESERDESRQVKQDMAAPIIERTEGELVLRSLPTISADVIETLEKYEHTRSASVVDWFRDGLLIETRFSDATQLHYVQMPLGMREQITFDKEPFGTGIVPPGEQDDGLLFLRDVGGGENYQMFWFDWASRKSRLLSDGSSRYISIEFSPSGQFFSYSTNERNGTDWDLHIQDRQGHKQVLQENAGVGWAVTDWHPGESHVLAYQYVSPAESHLYEFELATKKRTQLLAERGKVSFSSPFYSADARHIYFASDLSSEYRNLFRYNKATGSIENLTPDVVGDVEGVHLSSDRSLLAYTVNEGGLEHLYVLDTKQFSNIKLPQLPLGNISNLRFSSDGSKLALSLGTPIQPTDVYEIDFKSNSLIRWTQSEIGQINREDLVEPVIFSYPTFDKRDIPAFIYKPDGAGPHPVLIHIHGGPESQSRPRFSSLFQYLQNELGIAVIAPNVRGSRGYGKTYLTLDDQYKREDSVKDIGALLDWIVEQPNLDESRIAVYGGSYGGYMVLASMVHFADRLKCGVELVGIGNFVTFLEKTQGYRRDLRRAEYGDERIPEMRAFLQSIAPINHIDKMTKPMLIGQGLNDPRVPAYESEQMVARLEEQGIPVWYVLAKNEGHGFSKKANTVYFNQAMSLFLQNHLLD